MIATKKEILLTLDLLASPAENVILALKDKKLSSEEMVRYNFALTNVALYNSLRQKYLG
jgi:hypothetical protein